LTTFRRRSADFLKQLRKSKRPVVLTVKGRAAAVVQDAGAYQRLLDLAAAADAREGVRQGLEEARKKQGRPAREFFKEFEVEIEKKYGLSR
jgi:prevent-host-death family protein